MYIYLDLFHTFSPIQKRMESDLHPLSLLFIQFQYIHKCIIWNFYISNLTHSFFPLFLFLQKFFLSCDITAIAFRKHILSECLHRLPGDDFGADRCLNRDIEELSW